MAEVKRLEREVAKLRAENAVLRSAAERAGDLLWQVQGAARKSPQAAEALLGAQVRHRLLRGVPSRGW